MAKRPLKSTGVLLAAIGVVILGFGLWIRNGIAPSPPGSKQYVRYGRPARLFTILSDLQQKGIVRNARALQLYAVMRRHSQTVAAGTYQVAGGMGADELLRALVAPIRQFVRIPATNWAKRTANWLAQHDVLDSDQYLLLVAQPGEFKKDVDFPIEGSSLEGYLYPDTYDLPPLIGAHAVIERQLKAFDRKVWKKLHPPDLRRVLIIASMVQMEAGPVSDMPLIAGVIENRLKKDMPLQIDSTLLYGIQKWRSLSRSDYKDINSPYNTYTHKGLPPGPICSPTVDSIEAAMHPAKNDYLYYVALPNGRSIFSANYSEHLKKIKLRLKALHALKQAQPSGATSSR